MQGLKLIHVSQRSPRSHAYNELRCENLWLIDTKQHEASCIIYNIMKLTSMKMVKSCLIQKTLSEPLLNIDLTLPVTGTTMYWMDSCEWTMSFHSTQYRTFRKLSTATLRGSADFDKHQTCSLLYALTDFIPINKKYFLIYQKEYISLFTH